MRKLTEEIVNETFTNYKNIEDKLTEIVLRITPPYHIWTDWELEDNQIMLKFRRDDRDGWRVIFIPEELLWEEDKFVNDWVMRFKLKNGYMYW